MMIKFKSGNLPEDYEDSSETGDFCLGNEAWETNRGFLGVNTLRLPIYVVLLK